MRKTCNSYSSTCQDMVSRLVQVGAGFHLSIFMLDFAYTIATAATNPLDQTMRFTLGFDLAGIKDLVNNRK